MSDLTPPAPLPVESVKPDPAKPYKAYASILAVVLTTFIAQAVDLPPLVSAILIALAAGLAAYATPNPQVLA